MNSLDPEEQSVLFAKQADPAARGRFPGWLSDVTQGGCDTDKTFPGMSQGVFWANSEQGRVLADATSSNRP